MSVPDIKNQGLPQHDEEADDDYNMAPHDIMYHLTKIIWHLTMIM